MFEGLIQLIYTHEIISMNLRYFYIPQYIWKDESMLTSEKILKYLGMSALMGPLGYFPFSILIIN